MLMGHVVCSVCGGGTSSVGSINSGRFKVRALLGKICVRGSLVCFRVTIHGVSGISCSVSFVHFGIISGGITGQATIRRACIGPIQIFDRRGAISKGTAIHGIFIFPGVALPSSGILAIRVFRGNKKQRRSFGVTGKRLVKTGLVGSLGAQ